MVDECFYGKEGDHHVVKAEKQERGWRTRREVGEKTSDEGMREERENRRGRRTV